MADLVGLRVRGSGGVLQIDGNFFNLALKQKGLLSVVFQPDGYGYANLQVVASSKALIAFLCPNMCFLRTMSIGSGVINCQFRAINGSSIQWFLFDDPSTMSIGNQKLGLIVRNRITQKVVFDSRYKYMKVLQSYSSSNYATPPAFYSFPGRAVAIVQGQLSYAITHDYIGQPPNGIDVAQFEAVTTSSQNGSVNIRFSAVVSTESSGQPVEESADYPNCNILMIDVTGI